FADLPKELLGADNVQTAHADRLYKAVDLIEIRVKDGTVLWVAHDAALPRPTWLTSQFEPTDLTLMANGRPMKVFRRDVPHAQSLTLGSNYGGADDVTCNMYYLFVSPTR